MTSSTSSRVVLDAHYANALPKDQDFWTSNGTAALQPLVTPSIGDSDAEMASGAIACASKV